MLIKPNKVRIRTEMRFYFSSLEVEDQRGASVWKRRLSHLLVTKERQLSEGCLLWLPLSDFYMDVFAFYCF